MRPTTAWIVVLALAVLVVCPPAMADAIDIVRYLTRVNTRHVSIIGIVGKVTLLMLANYVLNLVVIGLPAIKFGAVNGQRVVIGLVWLTLLGQIADRLGAFVALFVVPDKITGIIEGILRVQGEGSWVWPLVVLNFFFSGIAVGILAFYFLKRRWRIKTGISLAIATAAAILTNPAWAMCLSFV